MEPSFLNWTIAIRQLPNLKAFSTACIGCEDNFCKRGQNRPFTFVIKAITLIRPRFLTLGIHCSTMGIADWGLAATAPLINRGGILYGPLEEVSGVGSWELLSQKAFQHFPPPFSIFFVACRL